MMMRKNILMRKPIHIQTNYHLGKIMNHMEIHQKEHRKEPQKEHQKNYQNLKITLLEKVMLAEEKEAAVHVVVVAAAPAVMSSRRLNAHSRIFVRKSAISKKAKRHKILALALSRPDLV